MKTYFSLITMLISVVGFGQDVINLKNKTSIKTKVLNVGVKTISYKKSDNLDGPSYELRNREVNNILYENGTQEIIQNTSKDFSESKNVISFNYGDLAVSRVGISYERLFAKAKIGLKIPVSVSFSNYDYYNYNAKMQTGLDFNYYPMGQKAVTFYTGLSTRIGKINQGYYYDYYDGYYYSSYYYNESNFISLYVNNGLLVHFNDHFSISGQLGLGVRNIYTNNESTESHVNGELNASFRF